LLNTIKKAVLQVHLWRIKNIPLKNFLLIISIFIGIFSGLLAVSLKVSVKALQGFIDSFHHFDIGNYLHLFYPVIGVILSFLIIKKILRIKIPKGIPEILHKISKKTGKISHYQGLNSFLGAIFTVGFGGSVGLEAPAAQSASAFGYNLGILFNLNHKAKILLIGCAASATLSAIFNAPIAAVVFALEVFMLDLTTASIVPLLLSSATALLTKYFLMENDTSFHYTLGQVFDQSYLPQIVLLGVFTGIFSAVYHRIYFYTEQFFSRWNKLWIKWLVGGIILGILIFLFPSLYGEGYDYINQLLSGNDANFWIFETDGFLVFVILMLLMVLFKAIASAITIQMGGIGGVFAPSLFIGGSFGFLIAKVLNFFGMEANTGQFTLLGMAGLVSGLLHAPLTAIFLIAEITGGYKLFLPLMIVTAVAFVISKYFEPNSIYKKQLIRRGSSYGRGKDRLVIDQISFRELIEKDFYTIHIDDHLGSLVEAVKNSSRNMFPVIDDEYNFLGIIQLDDIREYLFETELYEQMSIREIVHDPVAQCDINIEASEMIDLFKKSNAWNIVITDQGKYVGFVSRSKIFNVYRKTMIRYTQEEF
jgi:CIC family chloride channel protein